MVTLERYEQGLRAREQEVRKALQLSIEQSQAKTQEALAKQQERGIELAVVTEKLGNIEEEHEKHIQVLKDQIASLERYRGQLGDQQLDAAKQALIQGDSP